MPAVGPELVPIDRDVGRGAGFGLSVFVEIAPGFAEAAYESAYEVVRRLIPDSFAFASSKQIIFQGMAVVEKNRGKKGDFS